MKPLEVEDTDDKKNAKGGPDTSVDFDYVKYQWLIMIEKLVIGLNLKPEDAYKMNYIDALNWLSYWAMKDLYLNEMKKKMRI